MDQIDVAVIAGGKSKRFGMNKAVERYHDKQLIDIAIQTGYKISSDVFLVTGERPEYENLFAPVITDAIPCCGPLGGIYTALLYSEKHDVCVLPCDMPLLTPEVYYLMLEYRSAGRPVVASSERGLEPLVSIWPVSLAACLYEYLKADMLSLHRSLRELDAVAIDVPLELADYRPDIFININYREDLDKINRLNFAL